jgi:hypothetical protein
MFQGAGAGTVSVNGEVVLEPPAKPAARIHLAAGQHRIAIDLDVPLRAGEGELLWTPPGEETPRPIPPALLIPPELPVGGLLGRYHHGMDWEGEPAIERVDSSVAFYFHEIPLPRPFSVRWTGRLFAPEAGDYAFALESIDDSALFVDDREAAAQKGAERTSATIRLERAWHRVEVRYSTVNQYSQVYLYWTPPPGLGRALVPSMALSPPGPSGQVVLDDEPPVGIESPLRAASQESPTVGAPCP